MATLTVTSTADSGAGSLRQALENAASGDTIVFDDTTFPTNVETTIYLSSRILVPNKSLIIDCGETWTVEGAMKTRVVLDGDSATQVLSVPSGATLSIRGASFINGVGNLGGAVYVAGTFETRDCLVKDNPSSGLSTSRGGGVYVLGGGSFTAQNTRFVNNYGKYGGGVYILTDGSFTGVDVVFDSNKSERGAGFWTKGAISISGASSFIYNIATSDASNGSFGGGFYAGGDAVVSIASTDANTPIVFRGNQATAETTPVAPNGVLSGYSGGAIYITGTSAVAVENVSFDDNFAGKYGGAISTFSTFTANRCVFTNNVASSGGAVQITGTTNLVDCSFSGNVALKSKYFLTGTDRGGNGGAIFAGGTGTDATISGSTFFIGNQAENSSGAIDFIDGAFAFGPTSQTIFTNNVATLFGGAVAASGAFTLAGKPIFGFSGNTNDVVDVESVNAIFFETPTVAPSEPYGPNVFQQNKVANWWYELDSIAYIPEGSATLADDLYIDVVQFPSGASLDLDGHVLSARNVLGATGSGHNVSGSGYFAVPDLEDSTTLDKFNVGSSVKLCEYGAGISRFKAGITSETTARLSWNSTSPTTPVLVEVQDGSSWETVTNSATSPYIATDDPILGKTFRIFDGDAFLTASTPSRNPQHNGFFTINDWAIQEWNISSWVEAESSGGDGGREGESAFTVDAWAIDPELYDN